MQATPSRLLSFKSVKMIKSHELSADIFFSFKRLFTWTNIKVFLISRHILYILFATKVHVDETSSLKVC